MTLETAKFLIDAAFNLALLGFGFMVGRLTARKQGRNAPPAALAIDDPVQSASETLK